MTDIIFEIMVKVMTILGIATKEIHCGRVSELISHRIYDSVATGLRFTQLWQRNRLYCCY